MLAFNVLLVVTAMTGILTAAFWVRVASSRSVNASFQLDGAEKLADRANRRAFVVALVATALTVLLAALAYQMGQAAGAL